MGKLSTHVLDICRGQPAAGMKIDVFRQEGAGLALLKSVVTAADGRTAEPLLTGAALATATYQLLFHVGDYFAAAGSPDAGKFLQLVPVVFAVTDAAANYHVPLLVSPWSYSTYRGS